jgi:hypothetical protein
MQQTLAAEEKVIVNISVQNKSPRIRQDGEADCNDIATEIFARLYVSDVHKLRQVRGKKEQCAREFGLLHTVVLQVAKG